MTERQGRLVRKIQGYEGKDQKNITESIISLYLQEKVKLQKDEKKADDGVTEAAPLQDNDRTVIIDNDDM